MFLAELLATAGVGSPTVRCGTGAATCRTNVACWGCHCCHCWSATSIIVLRGDAVAAQALGVRKTVREDALRYSLSRIGDVTKSVWLRPNLSPRYAKP